MPSGVEEVHPEKTSPKLESQNSPGIENEAAGELKEMKKETSGEGSQERGQGEEGVEVVLGERGTTVVEESNRMRQTPDQNVFRQPDGGRPRAVRGPPPQPYMHGSGSWGYGPPLRHGEYPPPLPRPYPVPPYASSGSFEDQGSYHHHAPHYSPHIQYPPPRGRYSEDVNVISPSHKGDPHSYHPSLTPRPRSMPPPQNYYQYPPTSPVSRPGGPSPSGPPRVRNYAMRRSEGPYSKAQRGDHYHPEDGTWNAYPAPSRTASGDMNRRQPPLVTESSFDSEHHSHRSPGGSAMPPPPASGSDPYYQFYSGGGSWGSFDSAAGPPPHFDDQRYYNAPGQQYDQYMSLYSPGGILQADSFPPPYGPTGSFSYSYDEEERMLRDYHPDRDGKGGLAHVTPIGKGRGHSDSTTPVTNNTSGNTLLPKAAEEIDFEVTDPPMEPVTPPSERPVCESLADVNGYDVLCGRGGGTNSQIGNRRFRQLVQEFQPTYLLARRKEKPLLARTIVLIIRKRGGRFLKKDEDTGELYEVGDQKAEAKTSQALREGLDVRATKSAASSLLEKKKKSKQPKSPKIPEEKESPQPSTPKKTNKSHKEEKPAESPPTLPRLHGEEVKSGETVKAGFVHPHSPEQDQFRKRRRMRTGYNFTADRFFPDFCPPRADLGRPASPAAGDTNNDSMHISTTPIRRNTSQDDDDIRYVDNDSVPAQGCTGIALDMVTGAATGSFCLTPASWRR